jgi:hypothetical protein
MTAVWQDLIPHLQTYGIGPFGTDAFWGDMPDEPSELLSFYETPGPGGTYTKTGSAATEGRIQVLSRSESYEAAMQRALDAYAVLDGMRATLNGTRYSARALQRPFDVGAQDGQGRTIISCNYALHIR